MKRQLLHAIIGKVTNYSFDFAFVNLLETELYWIDKDSLKEISEENIVQGALNSLLTFYDDQWIIAKHYRQSPFDVDNDVISDLVDDLYAIIKQMKEVM